MKRAILVAMAVAGALIMYSNASAATPSKSSESKKMDDKTTVTYDKGCIIRGPRDRKVIALEFTGGYFADGGTTILAELKKRNIKASFFFIGDFYREPKFKSLIEQIHREGHYLGPHSDKHPLYASWDHPPKLLIKQSDFNTDLDHVMAEISKFGVSNHDARFFIPPFEHYTQEISDWTTERGMTLINYSDGTRSNADYMEDNDPKFVPAKEIMQSILDCEKKDPDGLNGFLLLLHIGAGPARTRDHSYDLLGGLLDELAARGYSFERVDKLLSPRP